MKKIAFLSLLLVLVSWTRAFSEVPTTPDIVNLVATSSSITVTFTANDDEITDGYYISYWKTSDSDAWARVRFPNPATPSPTYSYLIRGLDNNTQYTVRLTAYDGEEESSPTTDTAETSSVTISVKLVDSGTLQVGLDEIPSGVEYFSVDIGSSPGASDILDGGEARYDSYVVRGGLDNGTCYVRVTLLDGNREPIAQSDETAFQVDDFGTLFSTGDVDDGCFIGSSDRPRPAVPTAVPCLMFLLTVAMFRFPFKRLVLGLLTVVVFTSMAQAEEKSLIKEGDLLGVRAGLFVPSEKLQDEVYDSIVPVSLFFERRFGSWLSADVSAGYAHAKGYAVTPSNDQTGVRTRIDLIPLSMSAIANWDLDPLVTLYAGAGLDYWMFREKAYYGENKSRVSGWHGKAGVKLLTGDKQYYAKGGVLVEVCYTAIDRFGRNDVDLGGLSYNLGVMYCF